MICALLTALLLFTGGGVHAPAPTPSTDAVLQAAVAALRSQPVYVAPDGPAAVIDVGQIKSAVDDSDVVVAALPSLPAPAALPAQIGRQLGGGHSVVVLSGTALHAGSNVLPAGRADQLAAQAYRSHSGSFSEANVTGAIVELVGSLRAAQSAGNTGNAGNAAPADQGGKGSSAWVWVLVIALVLLVAIVAAVVLTRRRRRRETFEARKAEVQSLLDRLGSDVSLLDDKGDPVTAQALADASERYTSAGAAMAQASTLGQLAAVRRTAVEGLHAARVARTRLGLDPGPEIPPIETGERQLQTTEQVRIRDQVYEGHPVYTPGSPYYYGGGMLGGAYVPGGWYGTPFWEPFLLGTVLAGSWGGHGYGSGYDSGFDQGYDRGYEQGYEAGEPAVQQGGDWGAAGGDWGAGGGGDWGGGDWSGGDAGGGDWGGGGGDWGGDAGGGN